MYDAKNSKQRKALLYERNKYSGRTSREAARCYTLLSTSGTFPSQTPYIVLFALRTR